MLYIKVVNGKTVDHPVFEDNLIQAFGKVPSEYEPFLRNSEPRRMEWSEILDAEAEQYKCVDGVWTDIWPIRPMTAEERAPIEAEFLRQFKAYKTESLEKANAELQATSDANEIAVWNRYIEKLTACVFAVEGMVLPMYPRKFNNGPLRMLEFGNLNNVGSAPDVIE